jgi:hypothetical protein
MIVQQGLDLVSPVHAGAMLADVNRTPPGPGLGAEKHVGCADTFICIIIA